jgi:hypothetical protein
MGTLWSLVKAVVLVLTSIVALLVIIDGTLLANLMRKREE